MTLAVCVGIMGVIFLGDLWVKNKIEGNLGEGENRRLWGGKILLCRYHNRGMMLNLGQGRQRAVAFTSLAVLLVCLAVFVFTLGRRGRGLLLFGLSLLLGGAFSNTYDRLRRKYVVDYLRFGVRWRWLRGIVFNLSDFCIMAGALLVVLGSL